MSNRDANSVIFDLFCLAITSELFERVRQDIFSDRLVLCTNNFGEKRARNISSETIVFEKA